MSGNEFLSGALVLWTTALAWAAWAGLLAARWRSLRPVMMLAFAGVGAFGAWWVPAVDGLPVPAIVLAVSGGLAVWGVPLPHPAGFALALANGFAAGMAAGFQWATPLELAGGVAAWLLTLAAGHAGLSAIVRRPALHGPGALGRRVVGAWVLALGMLILLLSLFQAGSTA